MTVVGECQTEAVIAVQINGEPQTVRAGLTVDALLRELGIKADRVAVELNRSIVRQPLWSSTPVEAGAQVEIVTFVGGG
jgi:thiamine biosynthesis protein ThiS